jgi:hypothetical protein
LSFYTQGASAARKNGTSNLPDVPFLKLHKVHFVKAYDPPFLLSPIYTIPIVFPSYFDSLLKYLSPLGPDVSVTTKRRLKKRNDGPENDKKAPCNYLTDKPQTYDVAEIGTFPICTKKLWARETVLERCEAKRGCNSYVTIGSSAPLEKTALTKQR